MSEGDDEGFIVSKKFKSSHEKEESSCGGLNVLTASKAKSEAGSYFLGPVVKKYVRAPVTQCLARRKGTNDYFLMKILILDDSNTSDKCSFVRRTVFHNEYSILSLLRNCPGVIQIQDFFKDYILCEGNEDKSKNTKLKRVCMVLECLIPHGHHNSDLIPLNHYLKENRLSETEALHIFYNLMLVLEDLHGRNIVHRDLKLSNVILNRKTLKVKLMDFYYAKLLTSEREVQSRGATEGVFPKTCDMWSAGVILYAMLNGCLPFGGFSSHGSLLASNRSLREIYMKMMDNDCSMLNNAHITDGTKDMLRSILCRVPQHRLKASEAVFMVAGILAQQSSSQNPSLLRESENSDQIVPELPDFEPKDRREKRKPEAVPPAPHDAKALPRKISDDPPRPPARNGLLDSKEIRVAMLRLGATSVNSIDALSFSYGRKNSCRS